MGRAEAKERTGRRRGESCRELLYREVSGEGMRRGKKRKEKKKKKKGKRWKSSESEDCEVGLVDESRDGEDRRTGCDKNVAVGWYLQSN